MKSLVVGLFSMGFALQVHGAQVKANCVNVTKTGLIDDQVLTVAIDDKEVHAKSKNYEISGDFDRVIKNGSHMYSSGDLVDIGPDQTDIGFIFVSPELAEGKNGLLTFSVRQVGDSQGASWITEKFKCWVARE